MGSVENLPRLNSQYHRIDDPSLGRVIGGQGRGRNEIALNAVDPKSVIPNRFQVCAPGDENDFISSLGQSPAQITTDATGAKYRNTQSNLSVSQRLRILVRLQPSVRSHQFQ